MNNAFVIIKFLSDYNIYSICYSLLERINLLAVVFSVLFLKQFLVFFAPSQHVVNDGNERHAQFRDGIFAAWRQFGENGLVDQSIVH